MLRSARKSRADEGVPSAIDCASELFETLDCRHDAAPLVLIIEQSETSCRAVLDTLDLNGYKVSVCRTPRGKSATLKMASAVLLNMDLADLDSLSSVAELRLASSAPIIVYSTKGDVESVVEALQYGADDYIVAPIRPLELLARMKAISRRTRMPCQPAEIFKIGDVEIFPHARRLEIGGQAVRLSPRECAILSVLARSAGATVSRRDILQEVWGKASLANSKNLDVRVNSLRTKLGRPNLLVTVRGIGYRLGPRPPT